MLLGSALLFAFRSYWLPLIGGFLIVADPLQPADALVPLAGEPHRVRYAAELFRSGMAEHFVVTDMWVGAPDPDIRYADTARAQALGYGVPEQRIVMAPGIAATTYEEANNILHLARQQQWRSIMVVTSPSHTRRARIILRDVFDASGIKVAVRPIEQHWYRAHSWWQDQAGREETGLEYLKLLAHLLGYQ